MLTLYRPFLAFAHLPLLVDQYGYLKIFRMLEHYQLPSVISVLVVLEDGIHFCIDVISPLWPLTKYTSTFEELITCHAQQLPMIPSFSSFEGMVAVSFAPLGTFLCQNRCLSFHATLPQTGMEVTNFGPTIPLRTGLWNCWVIHKYSIQGPGGQRLSAAQCWWATITGIIVQVNDVLWLADDMPSNHFKSLHLIAWHVGSQLQGWLSPHEHWETHYLPASCTMLSTFV